MKAVLILVMSFVIGTSASADTLTQVEKNQACAIVRGIVPTEQGPGISHNECLRVFRFEVIDKAGSIIEVNMNGQTVEDLNTSCTVYLLDNPTIEIAVPAPSCFLE